VYFQSKTFQFTVTFIQGVCAYVFSRVTMVTRW